MRRKSSSGYVTVKHVATAWAIGALAAVSLVTSVPTAHAQDNFDEESILRGMALYRDKSLCAYCHGWNGRAPMWSASRPHRP